MTPHRVGDAPSIGGAWRRKVARQQAKHMCGTAPRSNLTRISTSRRRRRAPAVCEPLISHPQRSPNGYMRGPETHSRCVFGAGRATDVPAGTRSGTGAASSTVSCQSRRRAQHCQKLNSLARDQVARRPVSIGRAETLVTVPLTSCPSSEYAGDNGRVVQTAAEDCLDQIGRASCRERVYHPV